MSMKKNPLIKFIENMQRAWGPLDSNLITKSQLYFDELLVDPAFDVEYIHAGRELYRDPKHGFILLAYTEEKDLYRQPHDHGAGWVIYGVKTGEMEMATYKRLPDKNGELQLVRRETERLTQGESRVYLPGDIHHTKCLSDSTLMLRLTSCDLEIEKQLGRMNKYVHEM